MIAIDPYVWDFLKGNTASLIIFLGLLKGAAKLTKSVKDDKIATLLQETFNLVPRAFKGVAALKKPGE